MYTTTPQLTNKVGVVDQFNLFFHVLIFQVTWKLGTLKKIFNLADCVRSSRGENYLRLHEEFQPALKLLYTKRISARAENREENEWKLLFQPGPNTIT